MTGLFGAVIEYFYQVCQIKPSALFFTKSRMDKLTKAGLDRVMYETQGENYYRLAHPYYAFLLRAMEMAECVYQLHQGATLEGL